ncbi:MAG: aquaporin [Moraxellaceae bacterium]
MYSLARRLVAEALGSALLLAIVVGSGIMGEQLAGGNTAIALLANSIATGAGLFVLIQLLGPISGAHFNPVVTLVMGWRQQLSRADITAYMLAQICGAIAGVVMAHAMFDLPLLSTSTHIRSGAAQGLSEFVASFGLVAVILGSQRHQPTQTAAMVAAYITAAYWFTASTSFANPAVTLARSLSNSFAGIRPLDAPLFIIMQIGGALSASLLMQWLLIPARAITNTHPAADSRRES